MHSGWKSFVLLLVGFALLLNPLVPGLHLGSETVYRFEAASVDYTAGEGFEFRDVPSGSRLEQLPVDDQIICERDRERRICGLEQFVLENETVPTDANARLHFDSRYEFVFFDGQLYRPTTVARNDEAHFALEPVNDSDPLQEVASTDLSTVEQEAIESGRVTTYQNVSRRYQLLRSDGEYFVVYRTARKRYTSGHDYCISTGDGFCNAADWKRRIDSALTLGSWVGGVLLLFLGWERIRRPDD